MGQALRKTPLEAALDQVGDLTRAGEAGRRSQCVFAPGERGQSLVDEPLGKLSDFYIERRGIGLACQLGSTLPCVFFDDALEPLAGMHAAVKSSDVTLRPCSKRSLRQAMSVRPAMRGD